MNKQRKKGSGRRAGSGSFIKIPLGELNKYLRADCQIVISRKFCEALGIKGVNYVSTAENLKDATAAPIDVEIEKFD